MTQYASDGLRTQPPEALFSWQRIRALLLGITLPRPHIERTPSDLDIPFESFRIRASDGPLLSGWIVPGHPHADVILVFHGYGGCRSDLLPEIASLHQLGHNVVTIDFRGGGESDGDVTTIGQREALDVAATVAFARERWPGRRIVLYGISMGAAAILRATARDVRADGLILEAVFDSLIGTVANRFRALRLPSFPFAHLLVFWGSVQVRANGFAHNPVDYARTIRIPVLMLHGEHDPRATLAEARRVQQAFPERPSLIVFPGAGHESCLAADPDRWTGAISTFLSCVQNPVLNAD